MGKGDKKTRRGKIRMGSYGVLRPRGKKSAVDTATKAKAQPKAKAKPAAKKAAPAKPAAKKTAATKPAAKKTTKAK